MTEDVYALDRANAEKLSAAVRRVQGETREAYNVTPLDSFAYRAADNTAVTIEVTAKVGTSGPGTGLQAALLRFADPTALPADAWNDGEPCYYLPPPDARPLPGTTFANARLAGRAPDGLPIFTAGECCGWAADYYAHAGNGQWGGLLTLNTITGQTGFPAGSGVSDPAGVAAINNLSCRTYLTWLAPPFNLSTGGRSGFEVTVPANESAFIDAQIGVTVGTNTLEYDAGVSGWTGDYDTAALSAITHRCQLVYAEAALFTDLGDAGNPTWGSRVSRWLPVVRGQVVSTTTGMVPVGDRVPSGGAGFDMIFGFRGGDNAPQWAGAARTRHVKIHDIYPTAKRFGWVVNVWYDATWPSMWAHVTAQLWAKKMCCEGAAPQAPTVFSPPPPVPPPDKEDPPPQKGRADEFDLLGGDFAGRVPAPTNDPGEG